MTKTELRRHLANDELEQVLTGLLDFADQYAASEVRADALIQSGRLEAYKKDLRLGAVAYETLSQQRAAVRNALLETIENLPEKPVLPGEGGRLPGVSEQRFKSSLFWTMLLGNTTVLLWLWFQNDTGGFSPKEVVATLTLLLSIFTAYLMPMFGELLQHRHINLLVPPAPAKRLHWALPLLTYLGILPAYFGLLLYFIHLRGVGQWPFDDFMTALTLLSTGFGAYVGALINTLFRRETAL